MGLYAVKSKQNFKMRFQLTGSTSLSHYCRVVPEGFKELKEGSAHILYQGNAVFYNEAMVSGMLA